jgi:Uma2 family endonuclease
MSSQGRVYRVDPDDPRAPPQEIWDQLSSAQRQLVMEELPSEYPSETQPEGDFHRVPKERSRQTLEGYFQRIGRRVYLSSELPVYYPGEPRFAPDLIAVLDVDTHPRQRWVVSEEGKGIDFALEVTLSGSRKKDLEENVVRYARLRIPEYFVFDALNQRLRGYRLPAPGTSYEPIMPQGGTWSSQVLGLELAIEGQSLRFYHGASLILDADEMIGRLTRMVDEVLAREHAALARADSEQQRADSEQQRADSEQQRAERLANKLRGLGVDPDDE